MNLAGVLPFTNFSLTVTSPVLLLMLNLPKDPEAIRYLERYKIIRMQYMVQKNKSSLSVSQRNEKLNQSFLRKMETDANKLLPNNIKSSVCRKQVIRWCLNKNNFDFEGFGEKICETKLMKILQIEYIVRNLPPPPSLQNHCCTKFLKL